MKNRRAVDKKRPWGWQNADGPPKLGFGRCIHTLIDHFGSIDKNGELTKQMNQAGVAGLPVQIGPSAI